MERQTSEELPDQALGLLQVQMHHVHWMGQKKVIQDVIPFHYHNVQESVQSLHLVVPDESIFLPDQ
jgi:hypothetical protein